MRESNSESDDSDVLTGMEKLKRKKRLKEQTDELRKARDHEKEILRQLNEQCAKNAKAMKQLSEACDKFPIYFIAIHLLRRTCLEGAT